VAATLAHNEIDNTVEAYIANAGAGNQKVATRSGGEISVTATEGATIKAIGVGVSLAASAGGVAISFAFAGTFIDNVILSDTLAHIDNSVIDSGGAVMVKATDTSIIDATVGAVAVSLAGGGLAAGVAVGVA